MKQKISYLELAKKVGDTILCNNINNTDEYYFEHFIQGGEQPEDWNEKEDGEWEMSEIYQSYIITERGASELINHTDEIVGYNPTLDVFVWHITHFGTGWDYVFTTYDDEAEHLFDLSDLTKHIN